MKATASSLVKVFMALEHTTKNEKALRKLFTNVRTCAITTSVYEVLPMKDLSEREVEVLQLIADGNTDKELSARLGISFHTCAAHMMSILKKLRIHTRAAAVAEGFRRGWLK
jgi:DNA-binding CsgD family transcriptional regulator